MYAKLGALVRREQQWLTERITALAHRHGFDAQGPELVAGWAASVCGFLEPIERAVAAPALVQRLDADTDYARHPLTAYGIAAARRHRARGTSLTSFLALLKYYRRAHVGLLDREGIAGEEREAFHDLLDGVFDLVEIGVVTEWASLDRDAQLGELRAANRGAVAERLKYLTVFESVASPILILDHAGRIENANWAAMRTFASLPAEPAAGPGAGYYAGRVPRLVADRVPELLAAAGEDRPATLETVRGERQFRVTARALLDVTDERPGQVLLLADVSDYVSELAEARLVDRAKSAFIATMSHEIRTPLTGILGAAELLAAEEAGRRGDETASLTAIRASARVLLNLVDDVLDHARLEGGKVAARPAPVRLRALLEAAVAAIRPRARSKGLALDTRLAAGIAGSVAVDAAKLQRIVVNLLDNAVKFTDRGRVTLAAELAAGRLGITVADTGRGVDASRLRRLFEPYVREEPGRGDEMPAGSGLGLAICRRLAEVLGGTLTATSAPGVGSRFLLEVPVDVVAAGGAAGVEPAPATPGDGAGVLVVEDDAVNRMVTEGLLASAGFEVTAVATAAAALQAVERAPFDAVVLDLRLPDADGVALTRRLRARFATLPIVALTAFVGEDEEVACRRAGVSAYLRKPSGLHVLDATLRSLLAGGAAPAPAPAAAPADALDRDRLGGHLKVLGAGALVAVVEAFDRSVAACLAKLEAASAGGPSSELVDALHALRGAAGQLGLDGVAQRAGALEVAARTGDTARLRAEAARFRADLQSARRALGAVVDDLTGHWSSAAGD